ncbi:MAG TPA: class I SAM-dependent methyltransferase [Rubrivivax sp.]|nr:class I SAM-dependent methyltransferase [Rubrivivax sp.]
MTPEQYDAWYDTPRGRWIGDVEWAVLRSALELRAGESLLDVGCGTGHFARRAAAEGAQIVGLDLDTDALDFARRHSTESVRLLHGGASCLPFEDRSFDKVMSVAALCFMPRWQKAVAEIVRVSRRRFALGLLNRNSLLWLQKGRGGGFGAYRGAHWHTTAEIATVLQSLPVTDVRCAFGVFLPGGSAMARLAERALPAMLPIGGFMAVFGKVHDR